jgi:predicted RNase H-like HicB family nuclease
MSDPTTASKYIYDVSLETQSDGSYTARVLGLSDCQSTAATAVEALANVKQLLSDKITNSQIIQIEIPVPPRNNFWLSTSGIFKDDPYFEEMLANIEQYRKELDHKSEDATP